MKPNSKPWTPPVTTPAPPEDPAVEASGAMETAMEAAEAAVAAAEAAVAAADPETVGVGGDAERARLIVRAVSDVAIEVLSEANIGLLPYKRRADRPGGDLEVDFAVSAFAS